MKLERATLVAGVIAMIAGGASMALYASRVREQASGGAPVHVLVALADLPAGHILGAGDVATQALPESYLTRRHVLASDAERMVGLRLAVRVHAGEAILVTDVSDTAERRELAELVLEGRRAMSIEVDATSSFTGLLRPGDRVDVMHTVTSERREHEARVILQNVLVLATGRDTGGVSASADPAHEQRPREVTLSVTLEQAQLLSVAASGGRLSLVLRNPEDIEPVDGVLPRRSADLAAAAASSGSPELTATRPL